MNKCEQRQCPFWAKDETRNVCLCLGPEEIARLQAEVDGHAQMVADQHEIIVGLEAAKAKLVEREKRWAERVEEENAALRAEVERLEDENVALHAAIEMLKAALSKIDEEYQPEGYGPYQTWSELAVDNGRLVAKYAELCAAVKWMLKVGCCWGIERRPDGIVVVNLTWRDAAVEGQHYRKSYFARGKGKTDLSALLAAYRESQKSDAG